MIRPATAAFTRSPRGPAWLLALLFLLVCASSACAQSADAASSQALQPKAAGWPPAVEDNMVFSHILLNQFEARTGGSGNLFRWDGEAWRGTDMNRLWIKSEGFAGSDGVSDGDHEFLYDRPVPRMRYFDAQAGLRADLDSRPARLWLALGLEGLAPYFFNVEPTFYLSDAGHMAGRLNGSWDLYLTQRWALQPQAELNFYSKDDPGRRTGSGLSDVDAGVRLRFEVTRKFSPYLGWAYNGNYGGSAVYARRAREATANSSFVFGLRLWY